MHSTILFPFNNFISSQQFYIHSTMSIFIQEFSYSFSNFCAATVAHYVISSLLAAINFVFRARGLWERDLGGNVLKNNMASGSNEDIEETIRRCVRDEMRNFQDGRSGVQSLLNRTRSLIRTASYSTAREMEGNSTLRAENSTSRRPSKREAVSSSVPGHPYRPRKKGTASKPTAIPKSVHLIEANSLEEKDQQDRDSDQEAEVNTFRESKVVLKGEFDLIPGHTEDQIRNELVDVFKTKFPFIGKSDFDFIKRERSTIVRPAVKTGYQWDFPHVKNLCGQGRLYVQLKLPSYEIMQRVDSDDDADLSNSPFATRGPSALTEVQVHESNITPGPSHSSTSRTQPSQAATRSTSGPSHSSTNSTPGTSCASSFPSSQLEELKNIFPSIPENELLSALRIYETVPETAAALTDNMDGQGFPSTEKKPQCLSDILSKLKNEMNEGSEKLKVDEDDIVSDVLHYYKESEFNPRKRVRICLNGRVAIDTGGVLRQVFSDVFSALAENKDGLHLFKGAAKRKVPVFTNMHVLTGIFEVLGKIIAHSIIQNGPGFPCLAPVIYSYISSGDLECALLKASCMDVRHQEPLSTYIDQLREANQEDLDRLNADCDFMQMLMECGERRLVTGSNKLDVAQSLVTFNVVTKNIVLLDQMRKGLSILGLLGEIEKYPHLFEPLFVHQGGKVTAPYVKELLHVSAPVFYSSTISQGCSELVYTFIDSCDEQDLYDFLQFVTGSSSETSSLRPGCIKVTFTGEDAIYASTCLMELKIPARLNTQAEFDMAMRAVMKGSEFNTH